jgi:hypothetical protein
MILCFRPEDDEKLARGYPNLIVPVDGLNQDRAPAKSALKWYTASDPIYFTEWPREVLHRVLHIFAADSFKPHGTGAMKALETSGPPDAKLLIAAIGKMFETGRVNYAFHKRTLVYGTETIAGTDATLMAIANAFASSAWAVPAETLNESSRDTLIECVAFLLLRASPKVAKSAREKIVPLAPSVASAYEWCAQTIDRTLHGAAGVKRTITTTCGLESGALVSDASLELAGDDPDWVREMVAKAKPTEPMSVRLAHIAGPSVLANLSKRKWPAVKMPSIVRDFGMIRDPEIVSFMLSLVGKSSVKDAPLVWFRAHADYAKPILQKTRGDSAKAILRQL